MRSLVAHRIHVADDDVRLVSGLLQRVRAAVHADQDGPELADVVPQCAQVFEVVIAADDDENVAAFILVVMSGTPTPSSSNPRSRRMYSIVFEAKASNCVDNPAFASLIQRRDRLRVLLRDPVATATSPT